MFLGDGGVDCGRGPFWVREVMDYTDLARFFLGASPQGGADEGLKGGWSKGPAILLARSSLSIMEATSLA